MVIPSRRHPGPIGTWAQPSKPKPSGWLRQTLPAGLRHHHYGSVGGVCASVDIDAPKEGRPTTKINWLVQQLKHANERTRTGETRCRGAEVQYETAGQ